MQETRPNPIFRLMPSLTDVAFLMPLVFLFTRMEGVRSMLGDGDTGWHIRTGQWILAHGRIPRADIFSFTKPGAPWFAWEWLWDASFAWLYGHGGLATVVLASMFLICLTFALLFRLVNRGCGNAIVAIGLTVLAAAGSTIHWLARPHLVTMLFTVIFLSVLERVREGRTRLLWCLPVLTVLWTNLHGGFLVGIVILGAYAAGELARALTVGAPEERNAALRASIPYLGTAAAALAASLINPFFYHLHAHIWRYLSSPYEMKNIAEFQPANFQNGAAGFFELMLLLGAGAALWHGAHRRFAQAFLLAGWAHLALLSARNIPIYMIVAAPVVAPAIVAGLRALATLPAARWLRACAAMVETAAAEIGPLDRLWRVHAVCAAGLVFVAVGMASPSAGKMFKPDYDEKAYPARALALLEPSQRIFTHDEWGDYLIYRLSPAGTKVFIDGRSDFYGGKFCQEYIDLMNVKYDWEQTLSRYAIDTILLPPDAPLASTIKESRHWRVAYDDGSAIVFRPASGAAGPGETVSTSNTGGSGHGRAITPDSNVMVGHHLTQFNKQGEKPL